MKSYIIHFIRHGITEANLDGRYIGITDVPLSSVGIDQLEGVKSEGFLPGAGLVFSGPLSRCVESAEILYPDQKPIIIDELTEYNFGEFENKTAVELDGTEEYGKWISGVTPCPPGGEDSREFTQRICLGLNKMVRKMMDLGIFEASAVVHGGVMMSLFAACGLPRKRAVEWTCDPGTGYTARITPSLYGKSGVIEIINTIPAYIPEPEEEEEEPDWESEEI